MNRRHCDNCDAVIARSPRVRRVTIPNGFNVDVQPLMITKPGGWPGADPVAQDLCAACYTEVLETVTKLERALERAA